MPYANNLCPVYIEAMVLFQALVHVLVQNKSLFVKAFQIYRTI